MDRIVPYRSNAMVVGAMLFQLSRVKVVDAGESGGNQLATQQGIQKYGMQTRSLDRIL